MKQIGAHQIKAGNPQKLGVTYYSEGVHFAVEAPADQRVSLILFEKRGEGCQKIPFPEDGRIGDIASMYIQKFPYKKYDYAYEIGGIQVLDPYGISIMGDRCGFESEEVYEYKKEGTWLSFEEMILYKLHVRGFSKKAGKNIKKKGTFRGIEEAIPYFKELGINAVEFMPMYEWVDINKNYWGYAPVNYYFAPKASYCSTKSPKAECRQMIDRLHEAGIACIMEFYFPEGTDATYAIEALKYWKLGYGIDGFHVIGSGAPVIRIMEEPLFKKTKLFFDRVDDGWIYGAAQPVSRHLAEYNMDFMSCGRHFLKSDPWRTGDFMYQLHNNSTKHGVVKYMANNNGFTLQDVVSYTYKHNKANGENNQDGLPAEDCWSCGEEGPSKREQVLALRLKQKKNAILYTLLSQGTPLLYQGDELGNSQGGNNNAYAMDNEIGWIDWKLSERDKSFFTFVKEAIAFRKAHPVFRKSGPLRMNDYQEKGYPELSYHNESAWRPQINDTTRNMACMYCGSYAEDDFIYVAYNAHWEPRDFALPKLPAGMSWQLAIQTELPEHTELEPGDRLLDQKILKVTPRTVMVLLGKQE